MPPGRVLRVPFLRSLFPRGPLLPFTRPATRTRSPAPRIRNALTQRAYSTSPPPRPTSPSSDVAPTSLTGRLKALIKTHGWYALGVYMALSVLDFSLTFAIIYLIGADQVNRLTSSVRSAVGDVFHRGGVGESGGDIDEGTDKIPSGGAGGSQGVYAMAILAYGIHKTLWFPVRIGLTAAVTPRFVGFLTSRGWVGQGGARRAAQHVKDKVQKARDGSSIKA